MTAEAYIVAAARTPVAPSGGSLREFDYEALAIAPIARCLTDAEVECDQVDELILSNALGAGGNPARVTALAARLPQRVAGLSIDRQCVGGLDALLLARSMIASGDARIVLAGGSESHSLRPERSFKESWNGEPRLRDQARFTPWPDRDPDMAEAADRLAETQGITFEDQNAWAVASHAKARDASERLGAELAVPDRVSLDGDAFTRELTEALCARAPRLSGTISVANTSVAADGAAMTLVVSRDVLDGLNPGFALRIVDGVTCGGDPQCPGTAPIEAIRAVLQRADTLPGSLDEIELMEAYAAQAIACARGAGLPPERINRGGGSLARGHPIGASGAILAVRLFHELRRGGALGLAAIAAAGGLGTALLVEAVSRQTSA